MQAVTNSKEDGVQLHVLDAQRLLLLVATSVRQHRGRQVDPNHPGTSPGQLAAEPALSAAQVEDPQLLYLSARVEECRAMDLRPVVIRPRLHELLPGLGPGVPGPSRPI